MVAASVLAAGAGTALGAPKEIAFVCKGEDICLLDPDNPGDVFNLSDNGTTSYDSDPIWSPDGKRVAFVASFTSQFPPQTNIYSMEPEGPGQTFNGAVQITHFTNGTVPTSDLAWSPDGTKIAFVRGSASAGSQPLYVVNADGTSANATEIPTTGGAGHPTFSADSRKIAFWHSNQIYTVASDLSTPATPLPGAVGTDPSWSPDGSRIAYVREFQNLQIIGAGGGSPLASIPINIERTFQSWSPSGAQLAYTDQTAEHNFFRVVNADGTGNHPLPIVEGLGVKGTPPSWSPEGSRLAFEGVMLGDPSTSADDVHKVYVANADGTGSVTSVSEAQQYSTAPAWRPNPVTNPPPGATPPGGSGGPGSPGGSGGSGPLPGPTIKPQLKWFTNRIPWSEAPYVEPMKVACGAPGCNVSGTGTSKGAVPAGVFSRTVPVASASDKKKPKARVLARGKVYVPPNQTRALRLKLTSLAIKILKKVGKLKMQVTVTTTITGQAPTQEARTFEIFAKPKKGTGKNGHRP
jgi:Tol biopolymer transport system component